MIDDETKIELSGGNTSGRVVRVGNTVRKSIDSGTATVARLLNFLEDEGFEFSPKYLGIDDQQRQILSFLEGGCEISETAWQSNELLVSAARLLRQFHDISARFPITSKDQWRFVYPDKAKHEVICHNDFGLYNLVTKGNTCVGVIDFDLAGPGPRIRDIAYAAYWLVPLSAHAEDMKPYSVADIANHGSRLRLFCNSYGIELNGALLDMVSDVLHFMGNKGAMARMHSSETAQSLLMDGHLDHWTAEAVAFDINRVKLNRYLV